MPTLVVSITLFVLALLIGIEVIGKVPATLHTPLMSGANSIHGIGIGMHEDPEVPNYGTPGHGPRLEEGMCICIEPMITMGSPDIITLRDGWGVVTADGLPSAHIEHTITITKDGPRIDSIIITGGQHMISQRRLA